MKNYETPVFRQGSITDFRQYVAQELEYPIRRWNQEANTRVPVYKIAKPEKSISNACKIDLSIVI